MQLTANEIKDIVTSQMIDHQYLQVVNLRKHSQYLEGSKIGDVGCKYLSQANLPNLQYLELGEYY